MTAIQRAIKDLGHLNSPYYLKQLGYTGRDIKKAVKDGELEWSPDGNLNLSGATKHLSNIGRKGGQKSRRSLDSETAHQIGAKRGGPTAKIQDEFTNLPISRQAKHQRRLKRNRLMSD